MSTSLDQYRGRLNATQIAEGINAAQGNAKRLLDDAKLLLEAGRLPSAAALAILSIEERGKTHILKRLALVSDASDLAEVWRDYRSHRAKNSGWIIPQLFSDGARDMQSMAEAVNSKAEHAFLLEHLKQISLYTDCLGKAHWSIPDKIIDEKLVRSLVISAEMMWGGRSITAREIELWTEIVAPHYNRIGMTDAVISWQRAMVAEGLSDTPPEKLEAFMRAQPESPGNEPNAKDAQRD